MERERLLGRTPRFLFCFSFPCFVPILSVPQPVPLCVVIQNVDQLLVEYSAGGRFQIIYHHVRLRILMKRYARVMIIKVCSHDGHGCKETKIHNISWPQAIWDTFLELSLNPRNHRSLLLIAYRTFISHNVCLFQKRTQKSYYFLISSVRT